MMSDFGELKNSAHFRAVDVNLDDFYQDHRAKARIFVNKNINCVEQFERRIAEVFDVSDFYLSCNDHYLPPSEDIRIIKTGEVVRVVALKQETKRKQRKRDKECVLAIETENDNNESETAVTEAAVKKKRKKDRNRENDQTSADLELLNDLPLDDVNDCSEDGEKTTKKKKKNKRKRSKEIVEAEEPKTKKMKPGREQLIASDVEVASKKKLKKSQNSDSQNSEPDRDTKQLAKAKDSAGGPHDLEQEECSVKTRKPKNRCYEHETSPNAWTPINSFEQRETVPINTDLPQRKVNIVKTIIVSSGTVIDTSMTQLQQNKDNKDVGSKENSAAGQSAADESELVARNNLDLSAENCESLTKRKRNRTRKRKPKSRDPPPGAASKTTTTTSKTVLWPIRLVRSIIGPVKPGGRHIKFGDEDNIYEISSESGYSENGSKPTTQFQITQAETAQNSEVMTKAVKNEVLEQSQSPRQNNDCSTELKTELHGDKQNGVVADAANTNSQRIQQEVLSAADAKIQFDKAESDMEIDSIVEDIRNFNRTADEMDKAGPEESVVVEQSASPRQSNGDINLKETDAAAEENSATSDDPKSVQLGISGRFPEITEELITKSPLSSNYVPGVTDVIAFKILRISEQYTPEVSSYIAGQIVNFDANREVITLNISYGFDQCTPPQGKFSIDKEDHTIPPKDKTVEFTWPELLEIRRLSARC